MIKMRREAKVGLFALICCAALYWGINFLRGQDLFHRNNIYYATYDQVNGVQRSSAVMIKGFKVGVVSDISYDPEVSDRIVLELSIKSKYKIPEDSQARIFSDGLLGGKAIEIILGESPIYLEDYQTLPSFQDKDLFELAGSELEFIKQKAGELVGNINTTLESINTVFADNAAHLNNTMGNIAQMSTSLNNILTGEQDAMRGIIRNVNEVSDALRASSDGISAIVGNVEAITDSLRTSELTAAISNLNGSLEKLNSVMNHLEDGEGTLGKLLSDDGLYDSLSIAAGNLAVLLEDLKENPGRYVSISVFGRRNK